MNTIIPFGKNILVKPIQKKQVLISDVGTLCEYGEVIAVGDEVSKIKEGDIIGYTVWGINSFVIDDGTANGSKHYFVPESSEFILGKILFNDK